MTNATAPRAAVPVRLRMAAWVAASLAAATITVPAAALPPAPAPGAPKARPALDVYFLVDATASMHTAESAVKAAVDGVSRRLAARTTLRHGYGVFRDTELGSPYPWHVYDRLSPVRGGGGRLPRVHYEGGGDLPEGHVYGLDGALGEVHEPWTVFPEPAEFSPGARKVIVLVTSAEPKQGLGYPEMDDVVARLRKAGVAVATLWVESEQPFFGDTELRRLATRTGAIARGPVDCDGDRRPDLRRGDPLVCGLREDRRPTVTGFADALVAGFAS